MGINEEKASIRTRMRRICKSMDAAERKMLSEAACDRLSETAEFQRAEYILSYMAMPHECDPSKIAELAWKTGKKIAFPVCEEDHLLGLYIPSGANAFVSGKYGIWEPDTRLSVRIEPARIEFIIVPGVAFDRTGGRLGQGAGYYDRLLSTVKAFRAGFCFPEQMIEKVPVDIHDCPMDAIASADGCFFTGMS